MRKQIEALKLALEALSASDDFLFNYHDCEPNNEREVDAYSEVRGNNMKAWEAIRSALAEQQQAGHTFYDGNGNVVAHLDATAEITMDYSKPSAWAKAAQQQEPFGYFRYDLRLDAWVQNRAGITGTPFYTSPPAQHDRVRELECVIADLKAECKELRAQQQEPVACPYCKNSSTLGAVYYDQNCADCVKRMTAPASKPLTDEEIEYIFNESAGYGRDDFRAFARAIEAKLKERNA